jgi:mannose-1-phosphate guanylyltransferase
VRPGEPLAAGRTLAGFVEKPDAGLAAELVAGGWLWNAGLFLGTAATFLSELAVHAPAHLEAARAAIAAGDRSEGLVQLDIDALEGLEPVSFDRGVMEKTQVGAVVPFDCGWTDLGTWDAVFTVGPKDAAGNVAQGEVALERASDCLVHAQGLQVRVVGLSDVIVAATPAGVLVRPRR